MTFLQYLQTKYMDPSHPEDDGYIHNAVLVNELARRGLTHERLVNWCTERKLDAKFLRSQGALVPYYRYSQLEKLLA